MDEITCLLCLRAQPTHRVVAFMKPGTESGAPHYTMLCHSCIHELAELDETLVLSQRQRKELEE